MFLTEKQERMKSYNLLTQRKALFRLGRNSRNQ